MKAAIPAVRNFARQSPGAPYGFLNGGSCHPTVRTEKTAVARRPSMQRVPESLQSPGSISPAALPCTTNFHFSKICHAGKCASGVTYRQNLAVNAIALMVNSFLSFHPFSLLLHAANAGTHKTTGLHTLAAHLMGLYFTLFWSKLTKQILFAYHLA